MAKRKKLLPAHRGEAVDDSVLIRSAETLGRVIGSLQRQLDGAKKRVSNPADDAAGILAQGNGRGGRSKGADVTRAKTQGHARAASTKSGAPSVASKHQSTVNQKTKRAISPARSASTKATKKK
jgi:hypothetical protein